MKKVDISIVTNLEKDYHSRGTCFETSIIEHLQESLDSKYYKQEYESLSQEIKKSEKHATCVVYDIFWSQITIDFEFVKNLNIYSVINPKCFISDSILGKELINLMIKNDYYFLINSKIWESVDELDIELESFSSDFKREVQRIYNKEF